MKGPAEARVSTRPAALTAANKVENLKIENQESFLDMNNSILEAFLQFSLTIAFFLCISFDLHERFVFPQITWDQWRRFLQWSDQE